LSIGLTKLALELHPDKQEGLDEETREAAVNRFIEVATAHEILADPKTRKRYDAEGPAGFDFGRTRSRAMAKAYAENPFDM
jgi:DnaJ-class molecular chaperone